VKYEITKEDAAYAFIQARYNSTRLEGKVLKELAGKTLLEWSFERANNIHPNVKVVVLTGDRPENLAITRWCQERNILFFQGSENDVLSRFNNAAIRFEAKTIIRLTADNPLIDFTNALTLLSNHLLEQTDYSSSKSEFGSGMPAGIGVEIFSADVLSRLDSMNLSISHREHVNDYILENTQKFKCFLLSIPEDFSAFSFSIDTKKDFDRVNNWMTNFSPEKVNEHDYWKEVVESYQRNNSED
jgi:spore coat polysaccharide biosynthesis protein SpsF